ncbi:MAG: hypothetical protein JWQ43_160 [Glaciihabitans sp.]|nr:hypothetical protein [Glaciihabitans sp.]
MPRRLSAAVLLVSAVSLSLLLGGCSSDSEPDDDATSGVISTSDSITLAGSGVGACLPGTDLTDGYVELPVENTTDTALVVSGVSINSQMAAALTHSWILPANEDTGRADSAYFGSEAPADEPRWDERVAAVGATIEPFSSVMLALQVHRDADTAGAVVNGATLSYTDERGLAQLANSDFFLRLSTPEDGSCPAP